MRRVPPSWLIGTLAWTAGCVDAFAYLVLGGVFTANMTGNTSVLATALVQHDLHRAFTRGVPIALFVAGAAAGAALAEGGDGTRHPGRALLTETALLVGFVLTARASGAPPWPTGTWVALVLLVSGALGIQNAALTHPGTRGTHSTHVTGPLTDFATDVVRSVRRTTEENEPRPPRRRRLAWRWIGFFAGALSGAWLYGVMRLATPLVPAAVVAVVAFTEAGGRR